MHILVDDKREPKFLAYVVGGMLSVLAVNIANYFVSWPTPWYLHPIAVVLGLLGVFMIGTGCEAIVALLIASVPIAIVMWISPAFSVGKQLRFSAIVGYYAGKLWIGWIR